MAKNPKVDQSFSNSQRWWQEADKVREVLLECGLTEELKWGKTCYAYDGKNICIIQRMKDFLALLFFKGTLLKNLDDVLVRQRPNSRAGYRMRFTSVQDVVRMAESIKSYVREAIEVQKSRPEGGEGYGLIVHRRAHRQV